MKQTIARAPLPLGRAMPLKQRQVPRVTNATMHVYDRKLSRDKRARPPLPVPRHPLVFFSNKSEYDVPTCLLLPVSCFAQSRGLPPRAGRSQWRLLADQVPNWRREFCGLDGGGAGHLPCRLAARGHRSLASGAAAAAPPAAAGGGAKMPATVPATRTDVLSWPCARPLHRLERGPLLRVLRGVPRLLRGLLRVLPTKTVAAAAAGSAAISPCTAGAARPAAIATLPTGAPRRATVTCAAAVPPDDLRLARVRTRLAVGAVGDCKQLQGG